MRGVKGRGKKGIEGPWEIELTIGMSWWIYRHVGTIRDERGKPSFDEVNGNRQSWYRRHVDAFDATFKR